MPRVSVIVPAHDAAAVVGESLESVFAQAFDDWEVVLVDDASTDATAEVARGFGDRVRVLATERNVGPAAARNLAVENARGELLAMLDSDDVWYPDYLASQVELYDRESAAGPVGIMSCNAHLREGGEISGETWMDRVGDADGAGLDDLLAQNLVYGPTIARSAYEAAGGFEESLWISEDYDLWLRIVEAGYRVVALPRPLAVYRVRADSLMANAARRAASTRRVYERALERGALTPRQRRTAKKGRRLHALLERRARLAEARREGRAGPLARLGLLPATALVALEHPERWRAWIAGRGPRDPGAARRP